MGMHACIAFMNILHPALDIHSITIYSNVFFILHVTFATCFSKSIIYVIQTSLTLIVYMYVCIVSV